MFKCLLTSLKQIKTDSLWTSPKSTLSYDRLNALLHVAPAGSAPRGPGSCHHTVQVCEQEKQVRGGSFGCHAARSCPWTSDNSCLTPGWQRIWQKTLMQLVQHSVTCKKIHNQCILNQTGLEHFSTVWEKKKKARGIGLISGLILLFRGVFFYIPWHADVRLKCCAVTTMAALYVEDFSAISIISCTCQVLASVPQNLLSDNPPDLGLKIRRNLMRRKLIYWFQHH